MRVHVDDSRCEGHGRCYSIAPELFEPDEIGNGVELSDGVVPVELEPLATRAASNCPERAVIVDRDSE